MKDYAIIRLDGVQVGIADVIGEDASPTSHRIQAGRVLLDGSRLPDMSGGVSVMRLQARQWDLTVGDHEGMHINSWLCGSFKDGVHILEGAEFCSSQGVS